MKIRLLVLSSLLGITSAWGHHSLAAEYDTTKQVTIKGTITSIDWRNPHAWLYLDVKNESGAVEKWQVELGSPNAMQRMGWHQKDAKVGDELVVEGVMARDGSKTCSSRNIKFPDGRIVYSQSQQKY